MIMMITGVVMMVSVMMWGGDCNSDGDDGNSDGTVMMIW